jgi:hypothetical protein
MVVVFSKAVVVAWRGSVFVEVIVVGYTAMDTVTVSKDAIESVLPANRLESKDMEVKNTAYRNKNMPEIRSEDKCN